MEARETNFPFDERYNMNYNAVISVIDITDDSGPTEYPVTLPEMKDYLHLSDFEDTDDSPSTYIGEFTEEDILITELIQTATELFEEKAGLSITTHTKEAVITNLCGMQEIPYGPVIGIQSMYDSSGSEITTDGYTIVGNLWKFIKSPCYKEMVLTYTAGYGDTLTAPLPKGIKTDIMRLVAYMFTNRGDDPKIEAFAWQMASKYSRNTPIL